LAVYKIIYLRLVKYAYRNAWVEVIASVVKPRDNDVVKNWRLPYHINCRQNSCLERIKILVERDEEEDWFDDTESETSSDDGQLDKQRQDA
jgi:hypothetical protein